MKGRKRTPERHKVLIGTIRPDRQNLAAPVPDPELPRAPEWLPRRACEIFGTLTARLDMQQLASKSHTEMLSLLALRMYEVEKYTEIIEREGATYESASESGGTMHRARPEVALRNEAARHAQSLAAEFGMSPATIQKVSRMGGVPGKAGNPFVENDARAAQGTARSRRRGSLPGAFYA